jgi:glycosyltransferase involved in cell wall biosynthesis
MQKHKTTGCTKFDCCQYDSDPATCDDNACPYNDSKDVKTRKDKNPHCGEPPDDDGLGCGCAITLFFLWFWLPTIMFFLKLFGKKKKINTVAANSIKDRKLKIAFISVYNTPCGISTYNKELIEKLKEYVDIKVFAEYADDSENERQQIDEDFVVRCWRRNEHPKIKLINLVNEWNPDLIHIGHEYGFFSKAYRFTSLVSWFKSRKYPVVSTMHSIYEHRDKTVQEASSQYIIAHTENGKQSLVNKGIDKNKITIIPHGSNIFEGSADEPKLVAPLWNTWGNEHTIFQPGFLFDYKGHLRMLGVVAKLKEKYNDIHYIIQGSENPNNIEEHERVYRKIVHECKNLNIEENITINRGFVTSDILMSFIRTTKVCVLPYTSHPEHDVCSTSGIARIVIGTQIPLVTTKVHLFDDIDGLAFKASNDEELYGLIDTVFSEPNSQQKYNDARIKFLKETSWQSVAKQHYDLYLKVLDSKL